jgi:5-(carboxyamino)imidazole ribonucleotide mutase
MREDDIMPDVSIIMGSDSDLPVMRQAADILEKFGVDFEMCIISAHRSPHRAQSYATAAGTRGFKVIIAGAGGAAHLPGVLASFTTLPVIGVPIMTPTLNGVDSLYSIVQMPGGIPVATVGINNALNAGILAAQIIAPNNPDLHDRLVAYKDDMAKNVEKKSARLEALGYKDY